MAADRKWAVLIASTCMVSVLSTACFAADYWEAYVGADRGVFVDVSSIKTLKTADHRSLVQITFSPSFPMIAGAKIAYVANEKEVDCPSRRTRDLNMTAYSETGAVLLNSKRAGAWQAIGGGAHEERLVAVTCEGQNLPVDAVRFSEIKDARADYLVKSSVMSLGQ